MATEAVPAPARYSPRPVTAEAVQWFRNGDHPADNCRTITPDPRSSTQFAPFMSEGEIVRYYRNPDDSGQRECGDCGAIMHEHGWIDQGARGRVVCPGDWVVSLPLTTAGLTAHFPVAADVFAATWEPYDPDRLADVEGEMGGAVELAQTWAVMPGTITYADAARFMLDALGYGPGGQT
jgi:hypothetical protein